MNREMVRSKWLFCLKPRPQASLRLFCFPFGGGGASVFNTWVDLMGDDVEVRALQLPGREGRYGEAIEQNVDQLVAKIVQVLGNYQDKPFAIFGYSLGSMLAFEVTRALRRQNMQLPFHLFLAALNAPQLPPTHPPIADLADKEFIDQVEYYYQPGGEAWNNLELRELLLPILRKDIKLYENYDYKSEPPLSCPIDIFAGKDDRSTPLETTRDWTEQTTEHMSHHVFEGGHFFIDHSLVDIQRIVATGLRRRS